MKQVVYDTAESYGWLIATASQQLNHVLTLKFAEHGLDITTEQWCLLVHLMNDDGLSQQELAGCYMRSKVTVFKLISLLEKKGFVTRAADPGDKRVKRVFLTDYTRQNQALMLRLARENLAHATRGFSEEHHKIFKDLLRLVICNTGD